MRNRGPVSLRFLPETPHQHLRVLRDVLHVPFEEIEGETQLSGRHVKRLLRELHRIPHGSTATAIRRLCEAKLRERGITLQLGTAVTPVRRSVQRTVETYGGQRQVLADALVAPEWFLHEAIRTSSDLTTIGEAWFTLAKIARIRARILKRNVEANEAAEIDAYQRAVASLDGVDSPFARTLGVKAALSLFACEFDRQPVVTRAVNERNRAAIRERALVLLITMLLDEQPDNLSAARFGMVLARVLDEPPLLRGFLERGIRANPDFADLDESPLPELVAVARDEDLAPYLRAHPEIWRDIAYSKHLDGKDN